MLRSLLRYSPLLYAFQSFAFDFTTDDPVSCEEFSVSWTGGTAPFSLDFVPVFGTPRTVSIPPNAIRNGRGSFKIDQLPYAQDQRFLVTMSDSTGPGTGGASILFSPAGSGASCNTADPGVQFSFQLNDQLEQCKPYTFSGFENAVQPLTIMAIVPGGDVTVLSPASGSTTFDWDVNVKEGTSMLFMMTDARDRQGGSSRLLTVAGSGDDSCLSGNVPSSTSAATASDSPTKVATSDIATPTSSETGTSESQSSSKSTGPIIGGVIAALVCIGAVVALAFFYWRRKQAKKQWSGNTPLADSPFPSIYPGYQKPTQDQSGDPFHDENAINSTPHPPNQNSGLSYPPLQPPPPQAPYSNTPSPISPFNASSERSLISPFNASSERSPQPTIPTYSVTPAPVPQSRMPHIGNETSTSTSTIPSQQKALEAANHAHDKPARYMVHTDAADTNNSLVELPPQYTDHRVSNYSMAESRTSLAYAQDTFSEETPPR